jgi:hypothetical protein
VRLLSWSIVNALFASATASAETNVWEFSVGGNKY